MPSVIKFFNGVRGFNQFIEKLYIKRVRKDELAFDYGENGTEFFIILSGSVSV
jgi:CRP-like cAMP-binding protein